MKTKLNFLFAILILKFFLPHYENFELLGKTGNHCQNIKSSWVRNVKNEYSMQLNLSDTVIRKEFNEDECTFANRAEYGIFIPGSSSSLQGVLVLQHGCTMEQFGITKPYDIQYQTFAKKWNLAIVETALHGDCHIWNEPKSGSAAALFKILEETGRQCGHPGMESLPLLLWGHSAGGYWTLAMLRDFPERILGAVCYSAAGNPQWDYNETAAKVPLLLRHAGTDDGVPEILCWATATHSFLKLREMDAPVSIAHNKGQNHNFSYIRYITIPFFESVLTQRLPIVKGGTIRDIDPDNRWLGDTLTLQIFPESTFQGDQKSMCLFPDESIAKKWQEYVQTGTVKDHTPPLAPTKLNYTACQDHWLIEWEAEADIESGIQKFNVYVDDQLSGYVPSEGVFQHFDTNGDNTYPVMPTQMMFTLPFGSPKPVKIGIETVNHFNLTSERAELYIHITN